MKLGKALIARDNEIRTWRALHHLGQAWSRKLHVFGFSGHLYYYDGIFWAALFDLIVGYKYKVVVAAAIITLAVFLYLEMCN